MGKGYTDVYINLFELQIRLNKLKSDQERGAFIMDVLECIGLQEKGRNDYADKLMEQTELYREENRRRQAEYRARMRGENIEETETAPAAVEPEEKPAGGKRNRNKQADDGSEIFAPENKKAYGPFENVRLTDNEFEKLKEDFGANLDHALEILSSYKKSKGKTYKSDFAAFYTWVKRRIEEEKAEAAKNATGPRSFRQMDKDEAAQRARESFPGIMEEFGLNEQ